jgi:hypothetical protein
VKPGDFSRLALPSGMDVNPLYRAAIMRELQESNALYDDLMPEKRAVPDCETFSNPYTNSRILHRSPEQNMNTVHAGIDCEMLDPFLDGWPNVKIAGEEADRAHLPRRPESRSLSLFFAACLG